MYVFVLDSDQNLINTARLKFSNSLDIQFHLCECEQL